MLLALLAAVFLAVGIVVRQRATLDVPAELGVSPVMFKTLVRRPLWWAGADGSAPERPIDLHVRIRQGTPQALTRRKDRA